MSIPTEGLAMSTGMPSGFAPLKRKKTRRGKRHRGNPQDHLKNAGKALTDGDHASAKAHAFALIKALPAKEREEIEEQLEQEAPASPKPKGDARSRLALALKASRKL